MSRARRTAPAELTLVPEDVCPTCRRPFGTKARRVCDVCKKPILRHHKWTFEGSRVRHRFCEDPEAYQRKESAP